MSEIHVSTEAEVELTTEELSDIICEQLIIDGPSGPFPYLSGIALDGLNGHSDDVVDILLEYFRNEQSFDFTDEQIERLKMLLRDAHEG